MKRESVHVMHATALMQLVVHTPDRPATIQRNNGSQQRSNATTVQWNNEPQQRSNETMDRNNIPTQQRSKETMNYKNGPTKQWIATTVQRNNGPTKQWTATIVQWNHLVALMQWFLDCADLVARPGEPIENLSRINVWLCSPHGKPNWSAIILTTRPGEPAARNKNQNIKRK